jgi:hypothetical protein
MGLRIRFLEVVEPYEMESDALAQNLWQPMAMVVLVAELCELAKLLVALAVHLPQVQRLHLGKCPQHYIHSSNQHCI